MLTAELIWLFAVLTGVASWVNRNEWIIPPIKNAGKALYGLTPMAKMEAKLDLVVKEVSFNDGSSMKDSMERIESRQDKIRYEVALVAHRQKKIENRSNACVLETTKEGICIGASPAFLELTGLTSHATWGSGWVSAFDKVDRDRIEKDWDSAVEEGRDFFYRTRVVNVKSDVVTPVRIEAGVMVDDHGTLGWDIVIIPDFAVNCKNYDPVSGCGTSTLGHC